MDTVDNPALLVIDGARHRGAAANGRSTVVPVPILSPALGTAVRALEVTARTRRAATCGGRTSPATPCATPGRHPRARPPSARPSGARGAGGRRQGAPPSLVGSGPDDRDPQPFGRIVSRVSMDRGWSPRLTDATVLGRWAQLVGPDVVRPLHAGVAARRGADAAGRVDGVGHPAADAAAPAAGPAGRRGRPGRGAPDPRGRAAAGRAGGTVHATCAAGVDPATRTADGPLRDTSGSPLSVTGADLPDSVEWT